MSKLKVIPLNGTRELDDGTIAKLIDDTNAEYADLIARIEEFSKSQSNENKEVCKEMVAKFRKEQEEKIAKIHADFAALANRENSEKSEPAMERVFSGENNYPLTITNDDIKKVKERNARLLERHAARVRAKYGDKISDNDVLKVVEVEKHREVCANCKGLPCPLRVDKHRELVVTVSGKGEVYTATRMCRYGKVKDSQEKLSKMFAKARISSRYVNCTLADYVTDDNNRAAVEKAKQLLDGKGTGMFLYGAFGTGKTMLAAILASEFIRRGKPTLFYKVPLLLKDLTSAMFDRSEPNIDKESEMLDRLFNVPVLILDDFGMGEKISAYAAGRLSVIIDARYENKKLVTIITSNYGYDSIASKLNNPYDAKDTTYDGSRIVDRLKVMAPAFWLKGASRRGGYNND